MSLTKGLGHRDSFYRFLVVSIAFSNLYYTRILSSGFLDPQVVVSCFEQICSLYQKNHGSAIILANDYKYTFIKFMFKIE